MGVPVGLLSLGANRRSEAAETKVAHLDHSFVGVQQVPELDVTMNHCTSRSEISPVQGNSATVMEVAMTTNDRD